MRLFVHTCTVTVNGHDSREEFVSKSASDGIFVEMTDNGALYVSLSKLIDGEHEDVKIRVYAPGTWTGYTVITPEKSIQHIDY